MTTTNKTWAMAMSRLKSELSLKLGLLLVLSGLVYGPYLFLQHHHYFSGFVMHPGWVDQAVPFIPQSVWVYLSIYLLMPVGPFLMGRRPELWRYALGIVFISLVADAVFIFWPTESPRPPVAGTGGLYQIWMLLDNPFHAFPSLHAAFAVYSAGCGSAVASESRHVRHWRLVLWLWALLILISTLTTKQHVLIDVLAGGSLGMLAYTMIFGPGKIFFYRKTSSTFNPHPELS